MYVPIKFFKVKLRAPWLLLRLPQDFDAVRLEHFISLLNV